MEMTQDQKERLKLSMDRYQIYVDHGIPVWEDSDKTLVNEIRKELGLQVHEIKCCPRSVPELVFREIHNLYKS